MQVQRRTRVLGVALALALALVLALALALALRRGITLARTHRQASTTMPVPVRPAHFMLVWIDPVMVAEPMDTLQVWALAIRHPTDQTG